MRVQEVDRRTVLACLHNVEAAMAEAKDVPNWWCSLSPENRREWWEFLVKIRTYQHELSNL
jgi:hypothetical protein